MQNLYKEIECTVCGNQAKFGGRTKPFCSRKCKGKLSRLNAAKSEISHGEWAIANQPEGTHASYRDSIEMYKSIINELVAEHPKMATQG